MLDNRTVGAVAAARKHQKIAVGGGGGGEVEDHWSPDYYYKTHDTFFSNIQSLGDNARNELRTSCILATFSPSCSSPQAFL